MSDLVTRQSSVYKKLIKHINAIDFSGLSDSQLKNRSHSLRVKVEEFVSNYPEEKYNEQDEFITESFALVKEAVFRVLNIRVYDEQLWAGLVLNSNALAEMATGEGKTIAAVFSAYLNCLDFGAVHIFTFNDYLAGRDAKMMGPVYNMLGITAGHVYAGQDFEKRKTAYKCDVTYMTVKECGFDYLREFLSEDSEDILLPDFSYAIVDEADSILIDEARIPLVIAGPDERTEKTDLGEIKNIVDHLKINEDYEIDEYASNIFLTEKGIETVEKMLGTENLYDESSMELVVSVNNALYAKELLKRDVDYVVKNGKIELVDEFTGRIAEKRHWPHGLHEAIEAKEMLSTSGKGRILNQITLQNFIRIYPRLSGMTGTAHTSAKEFDNTYDLKVHVIPTHNPMIRKDNPAIYFWDKKSKEEYIIKEVENAHRISRPVLLGTSSVGESEKFSELLLNKGISCKVLNAKNDAKEAEIISKAGCPGSVIVSTNMAGRGIDIKLGGEDKKDHDYVVESGGLLVIGTNLHESVRVDNQLRGRSGRQGDPGESKFIISLEDEIFIKYNFRDLISDIRNTETKGLVTNKKILKEAMRVQKIVEGSNYDIRQSLMKYTTMLQDQSEYMRDMRREIFLMDNTDSFMLKERFPEKYKELSSAYGTVFVHEQEKLMAMKVINQAWVDYLDNMSYIKDSIHILKMSGMDPLFEYNKILYESFSELKENINSQISECLSSAEMSESGFDFKSLGLISPDSTWTYVVSNTADQLNLFPFLESLTKLSKKKWFE